MASTGRFLKFSLCNPIGVRDITGIPVNRDSGVPQYVSRYAFDTWASPAIFETFFQVL